MSSYKIQNSPIWLDIKSVLESSSNPIKFDFKGMLHTVDSDMPVLKIMSLDIIRDYMNNIGDVVNIEFKLPLGEYLTKLYPYRKNLEFSIKKLRLEETDNNVVSDEVILIEKYKAVFLDNENPNYNSTSAELTDTEELNLTDTVEVKLQLMNRSLEPLRIKTLSGVFRQVTMLKLLYNLLSGESSKIKIEGKPAIDAIEIQPPSNLKQYSNIVLKAGTHVIDLPSILQKYFGGVYNAGIGNYFQTYENKKTWFVYPLFKTTEDNSKKRIAIIYSAPKEVVRETDRTYNLNGNTLSIIANNNKEFKDPSDSDYMNHGSGFRMADANAFMKKPVKVTEKGIQAVRGNLSYEVGHVSREDNLNYAPVVKQSVSSNPFIEYSKVIARSVGRVDVIWENSNPDMLYPGMFCKFIYLKDEKIVELNGIVVFAHAFTSLQGNGIDSKIFRTNTQLTLLLEPNAPIPSKPNTNHIGDF